MDRPVVTYNLASVDGRLTLAPGVSLLTGDDRWTELTSRIGDPYEWVRQAHDPQVLLEGSGSFLTGDAQPVPRPGRTWACIACLTASSTCPADAGSRSWTGAGGLTCSSPSGRTLAGLGGTRWS